MEHSLIITAGYRPYSVDKKAISKRINRAMMETHQFHKTAQLRLLEIVKFPIKTSSHLPLVACVLMQYEGVVMQFEARTNENT